MTLIGDYMSRPFQWFTGSGCYGHSKKDQGLIIELPSERKDKMLRYLDRQVRVDSEGEGPALMAIPELENYSYRDHDIYCEGPCAIISNTDKRYYEALISLKRSTNFHRHTYLTELVRIRKADDSVLFMGSWESSDCGVANAKQLSAKPLKDGMILSLPVWIPHGFYVPKDRNLILELVTNSEEYEEYNIPFELEDDEKLPLSVRRERKLNNTFENIAQKHLSK